MTDYIPTSILCLNRPIVYTLLWIKSLTELTPESHRTQETDQIPGKTQEL